MEYSPIQNPYKRAMPLQIHMLPDVKLPKTDLAYIAGLLDVGGSFLIIGGGDRKSYCLQVVYRRTSYETVKYLADSFGGNLKKIKSAPVETWSVVFTSRKAYRIIKQIFPFLIVKRKAAEYCMRFLEQYWRRKGDSFPLPGEREQIGAFYRSMLEQEYVKSWSRPRKKA